MNVPSKFRILGAIAGLVFAFSPLPAAAGLIGDGVVVQFFSITPANVLTQSATAGVLVGPGKELNDFVGLFDVDISDSNILIGFDNASVLPVTGFFGLVFSDLDFGPGQVLGSLSFTSNIPGFGTPPTFALASMGISPPAVAINLSGLSIAAGSVVDIRLNVPEPTSLALLVIGIVGLGWKKTRAAICL
jgi:hypothetical protein